MNNQINYNPKPIDTSDITLPEEMMALAEQLAKNVHDVWAQTRMNQGWTYGEQRDDILKKHPDLIPYEELPDGEKEYDRNTSQETLKTILKLGFKIERLE
jgi:ryanodine receptor 2